MRDCEINQIIIDELFLYTLWLVKEKQLRYPTFADEIVQEYLKEWYRSKK